MTSVAKLKTKTSEEGQLRIDLAAVFRLAEHFNWHEGVANHFSLAVSTDGKQFLMNPKWRHFSAIKASDLLLLDADDKDAMRRPNAPDETAWCIHGRSPTCFVPGLKGVPALRVAPGLRLVSARVRHAEVLDPPQRPPTDGRSRATGRRSHPPRPPRELPHGR